MREQGKQQQRCRHLPITFANCQLLWLSCSFIQSRLVRTVEPCCRAWPKLLRRYLESPARPAGQQSLEYYPNSEGREHPCEHASYMPHVCACLLLSCLEITELLQAWCRRVASFLQGIRYINSSGLLVQDGSQLLQLLLHVQHCCTTRL